MINLYNQVPTIYSNASRDFQYMSWLINIVLNSVKHNVDDIYELPNNKTDPKLTELLAITLGFKIKRSYDQRQLEALASIIPSILKCKGTLTAVKLAGKALVKASGTVGIFDCSVDTENSCIEVVFPEGLVDTILFMDLLPYILPAGMTCRIVKETRVPVKLDSIDVGYSDALHASWESSLAWDSTNNTPVGLATLYEVGTQDPIFTNYKKSDEQTTLNTGLLSNNVIPSIAPMKSLVEEYDYTVEGKTVTINKFSVTQNEHGTTVNIGGT